MAQRGKRGKAAAPKAKAQARKPPAKKPKRAQPRAAVEEEDDGDSSDPEVRGHTSQNTLNRSSELDRTVYQDDGELQSSGARKWQRDKHVPVAGRQRPASTGSPLLVANPPLR